MPSDQTGLLDTVLSGLFDLETLVALLACSGALGYLTYEWLLAETTVLLAAVGGGAAGVAAAVALVVVGRRLWF